MNYYFLIKVNIYFAKMLFHHPKGTRFIRSFSFFLCQNCFLQTCPYLYHMELDHGCY